VASTTTHPLELVPRLQAQLLAVAFVIVTLILILPR
jgi:hypothetical protein